MTQQFLNIDQKFTLFVSSIRSGSITKVQQLLREDSLILVNRIDSTFRQPSLYFAAVHNADQISAEIIKLLIRHGANPNFKDHNGQTILFYVCRQGKQQCAQILLSHGLSLDEVDVYGQTPLFYAVSQNRLQMVRKYSTKQRVNHIDTLANQHCLFYAARRGHVQMSRLLMQKGAQINIIDSSNKTVVDFAKKTKSSQLIQFLSGQYKKYKQQNKPSNSQQIQKKHTGYKKKQQILKQSKQVYKIVVLGENGQTRDLSTQQVQQLISKYQNLQFGFNNPDSISSEQLNEGESWDKLALKILNMCCKQKNAFYFLQPVDPAKFNIMDYFDIVTQPMDFGTIKKRLMHNYYKEPINFVEDMNLIWNNCYKYNGTQHTISKAAKEVQNAFNQLIKSNNFTKLLN